MTWTVVEDAIQKWLADATGIPGNKCVWVMQDATRRAKPFATLMRDGGQDEPGTNETRIRANLDADPDTDDPPADLILQTVPQVEFTVSVQTFTDAVQGDTSAFRLLDIARNKLGQLSQLDAFETAGVAVVDRGTVQNLSTILETQFEGRAALVVRFRVADMTEETIGQINTAPVSGTYT